MEIFQNSPWQNSIGIVGAIDSEVTLLENALDGRDRLNINTARLTSGTLQGSKVIVARSGVGKVNAAACAQTLAMLGVSCIINTGTAGAVGENLRIGDYVVATSCVQHDVDVSHFGFELGHIPGFPGKAFEADSTLRTILADTVTKQTGNSPFEGCVISGDRFISDTEEKRHLSQTFGALCCDMEAAALAQVCTLANIPFAIVRVISDLADGSGPENYRNFESEAAYASAAIVQAALLSLNGQTP